MAAPPHRPQRAALARVPKSAAFGAVWLWNTGIWTGRRGRRTLTGNAGSLASAMARNSDSDRRSPRDAAAGNSRKSRKARGKGNARGSRKGRAGARPAAAAAEGWQTTDADEIALRRWRGSTEIVAIEALEPERRVSGRFARVGDRRLL